MLQTGEFGLAANKQLRINLKRTNQNRVFLKKGLFKFISQTQNIYEK